MARKSPFTNRQLSRIVVLWAQHQSLAKVRREFAKEFHLAKHPRLVPSMTVFRNTITRFNETASAKPNSGGGSKMSVRTPQNILRVKDAIDEDKTLSVRALSLQLDIDQTTVWRILRKDLMMFPYKAKQFLWEPRSWRSQESCQAHQEEGSGLFWGWGRTLRTQA